METDWFKSIKVAEKTAILGNNLRKIHFKFPDGREMVEEYNLDTGVLSKRAWKTNNQIYKNVKWEVEVGDPVIENSGEIVDQYSIKESKESPYVIHRVTKTKLEWRIRNLPYELNVYQVEVDSNEKNIVVRTTNKKYFKTIPMLELQRLNLSPNHESLKYSHFHNTLIITYQKPPELLSFEMKVQDELNKVQPIDNADIDCKPS